MSDLIQRLKDAEGFQPKPYRDSRGILTIGYGTDIEEGITEHEASWLLEQRVEQTRLDLARRWDHFNDGHLTQELQDALVDAAYQLGVPGLLEFHNMLMAIEIEDWQAAEREARDSEWNKETPKRVDYLVSVFRKQSSR